MAAVDVIVEGLMSLRRRLVLKQNLPRIFVVLSLVGSVLKDLDLVPQTYFSSSKNVLNVYFVKVSWGWTLLLLTPFLLLSNWTFSRSGLFLGRRSLSLVVATAVWYVCTEAFVYIEDATGACYNSSSLFVANLEFTSRASCRRAGFFWSGYDISGHAFILTYSALLIVEETSPMALLRTAALSSLAKTSLGLLYVALNLITLLWLWMFVCTSVYFHDLSHKLLGTLCGLLAWYLTYRLWYLKPFSPGPPPQRQAEEQKQHA